MALSREWPKQGLVEQTCSEISNRICGDSGGSEAPGIYLYKHVSVYVMHILYGTSYRFFVFKMPSFADYVLYTFLYLRTSSLIVHSALYYIHAYFLNPK